MKKQLFSLAALLSASLATASGGMVFTDTINSVLPNHPSLNGTYWGWSYRTNLSNAQVPGPQVFIGNNAASNSKQMLLRTGESNFNSQASPGTAGYRVFARRDPSIDFRLGSSIRARISSSGGHHVFSDSPVPGSMIGIQDSRGYYFGIGLARDTSQTYIRIVTSPFTGAGSEWIPIPKTSTYFNVPESSTGDFFDVELVIAGSRASILVSSQEMKNAGGNVLTVDAGAPLTNLIFSDWINHGGAIVGDYSLTSSGFLSIQSLSYY